jgi:hypothetical protein
MRFDSLPRRPDGPDDDIRPITAKPGLFRRIAGSISAALVCWFTFGALVLGWDALHHALTYKPNTPPSTTWFLPPEALPAFLAFYLGLYIFPGFWLFVFLPLYFSNSRDSAIWRWQVSTTTGTLSCIVLIFPAYDAMSSVPYASLMFVVAALTGGVTGLYLALTANYFLRPKNQIASSVGDKKRSEY